MVEAGGERAETDGGVGLEIGGLVGGGNRGGASEGREPEDGQDDDQSEERGEAFQGGRGGGVEANAGQLAGGSVRGRRWLRGGGRRGARSVRDQKRRIGERIVVTLGELRGCLSGRGRSGVEGVGDDFVENDTDAPIAHTVGDRRWANGP
jgi:hypothetical protein